MDTVDIRYRSPPHPNPLPEGEGTRPHTIALYTRPAHADAWHQVRAAGGYEWWYFDADDARHDRRIVAALFQGFPFHPRYLRDYVRYRRFPTRVRPPLPEQFSFAYVALHDGGGLRSQSLTRFAPHEFTASTDGPDVIVGPNRMTRTADGIELRLESHGLRVSLQLRPRGAHAHGPLECTFPSRALGGADHRWVLAGPLCDVEGSIRCGGDELAFRGRGYRDHCYGTGPLGPGLSRWFRGRVLLGEGAYAFQFARPCDRALRDEACLVECTPDGVREILVSRASCEWSRPSRRSVSFPRTFALDDDVLHLHNPRAIDASALHARVVYDAVCRGGRCGEALCTVVEPQRLRVPLLGRLIEMSIDNLAARGRSSAQS